MKIKNFILLFIFIGALTSLEATTLTWIGGTGVWENANNWDTGEVPTSDDGVVITNGTVTISNYAEANYIHLDGGNLEVEGALLMKPNQSWYNNQVRGIVVGTNSSFDNFGKVILQEPNNANFQSTHIFCYGNMTNHPSGFIYSQGQQTTGIHSYGGAGIIHNYGEIIIPDSNTGLYLLNEFRNYGNIEVDGSNSAVTNRSTIYCGSASIMKVYGTVTCNTGSYWNLHGLLDIHFSSSTSFSHVIGLSGSLEIQNSGVLKIAGSNNGMRIYETGEFRVRGDLDIENVAIFKYAIINDGFMVNHQKGKITTNAHYGVSNIEGKEIRNYGIWNMLDPQSSNYSSLRNDGIFSNRPKGKLTVHGKLNLKNGSIFNNQGHMFIVDDEGHQDLSGTFNNTGTLNDRFDEDFVNNNSSIIVHKIDGPLTEGVPVSDILDIGSNPGATVLGWYTGATGNTLAGSYDANTNTFTPNGNAVGLSSLFVRTRINVGGVTRRHELIVENGINSSPSPLVSGDSNGDEFFNTNFTISPNPVTTDFNIEVEHSNSELMKFELFDVQGQRKLSGVFDSENYNIRVPHDLSSGLYFLRILDKEGILVKTQTIRVLK